jgi:Methyltransferase domain
MVKRLAKRVFPAVLWHYLRRGRRRITSSGAIRKHAERFGYLVSRRTDYYSPLSAVEDLRVTSGRWNRPSTLSGLEYDLASMKQELASLVAQYYAEFAAIPPYSDLKRLGFGPGYTAVDAVTLFLMVRHLKPKRYIEVGSGLSTYYCSLAAEQNRREGMPAQITCIEPHPYERLYMIPDIEVRQAPVQDIDVAFFRSLEENDILFVDSSHMVKIDGDVPYLVLEVLPNLKAGVHIHIHDVSFPYNIPYPPQLWVFGRDWPMLWNEAMMVQAFLCGNRQFQITMSTPLLRFADEPFLQAILPIYETVEENPNTFSALWLKKVA